ADRRNVARRADMGEKPIVAPAAGNLARVALAFDFDFEHEALVIFKAASKFGGEDALAKIDPIFFEALESTDKSLEREANIDDRPPGNPGDTLCSLIWRPRDGKEIVDNGRDLFPERLGTEIAQEVEQPRCDLAQGAVAGKRKAHLVEISRHELLRFSRIVAV